MLYPLSFSLLSPAALLSLLERRQSVASALCLRLTAPLLWCFVRAKGPGDKGGEEPNGRPERREESGSQASRLSCLNGKGIDVPAMRREPRTQLFRRRRRPYHSAPAPRDTTKNTHDSDSLSFAALALLTASTQCELPYPAISPKAKTPPPRYTPREVTDTHPSDSRSRAARSAANSEHAVRVPIPRHFAEGEDSTKHPDHVKI